MSNLKNEGQRSVEGKPRLSRGWALLGGLVLVALLALAPTLMGLAEAGGGKGNAFDVTFTKWVTSPPNMVGVVGGDVGPGTFAGEIQSMSDEGDVTTIAAVYHINGSEESFTANIQAVQNNSLGTGVITGEITKGWLKGKALSGEYNVVGVCPIKAEPNAFGTMCFQGTLHIVSAR